MGKVTNTLIITNVVIFLLVFSMPQELMESTFALLDFSGASMFEVWRWFTTMFLHGSASHLFFNMIALYFFGRVLEEETGAKKFLIIYFLSGLAGSLVYGLTSIEPAVGASGCIFGVMGAAMFFKPKELIHIYVLPLPLGLIAILYVLSQVALSTIPMEITGIAYMAHIGGLITGSVLMFYFEPKASVRGFLTMILLLIILVVLFPIFGIIVGIGQLVLSFFDFIVGIILYGLAYLLFSWIWA
jgi:membrane associated rhomboid family serine protease